METPGARGLGPERRPVIDKRELLDEAAVHSLLPSVVEKDYALGWALAGIYAHPDLKDTWVFKGGTCLKKCFFETYRFSEDLDFTLTDPGHLDADFLRRVFGEVSAWIYEATGLEFPTELQAFDLYRNPRGNLSCQGKLGYAGPLAPPRSGGLPRVKLDLTADEHISLDPVQATIFHPYSDAPEGGIQVLAYAYEEAFAEKVRALAERARPRDLYDVVNLFRNEDARPAADVLLDVLQQKCQFKGIEVPSWEQLATRKEELSGPWQSMLGHQLPSLPPLDAFWDALPGFFAWLAGAQPPVMPAAFAVPAGETVLRDRRLRLPVPGSAQTALEVIRFAAANRLCVDLGYQGSVRRIEPYSLRRTSEGNIILHAFNVDKQQHRSYRVDRIRSADVTSQTFVPRYEIELTPVAPVRIPPTSRSASPASRAARPSRRRASPSTAAGPTYVYECGRCGRRFSHIKPDGKLRAHKDKSGHPCGCRSGYLVDTQYR
jgi:predicted nucleotidyltransferase component of viral defense system/DNA-directed RNA polymerase subunit RPC12/RpoP